MHWCAVALRIDATAAALWIGAVLLYYAALRIGAAVDVLWIGATAAVV